MSVYEKMTAIADAIRGKTLEEEKLSLDAMARQIGELSPFIVPEVTGEAIALTDSSNRKFRGMTLYGKTTQDGTPTPDAPVALVSAGDGGSVGVSIVGKNLLNVDFATTTKNGVTFTNIGGGGVTVSGTTQNYPFCAVGRVFLYANTWYYITMNGSVLEKMGFRVINRNVDPAIVEVNTERHFTVDYTGWHAVEMTANPGFSGTTTVYPMIKVGSTATEYEHFKTLQTLPVSTPNGLAGIPVDSGGNCIDSDGQHRICDVADLARGVRVQKVKYYTCTGSEDLIANNKASWTDTTAQFLLYLNGVSDIGAKESGTELMFSHGSIARPLYNPELPLCIAGQNTQRIYFGGYKTIIGETKESCQAYLAEQYNAGTPLVIAYPTTEPIETPLSDEELAAYAALHTNYPNTTIFSDAGVGMKVSYVADTENFVAQHADTVAVSVLEAAYQEGVDSI